MNRKLIVSVLAALLLSCIMAAALLIFVQKGGQTQGPENNWSGFFEKKGLFENGSVNRTVSAPEEVAPGIYHMTVRESFAVEEAGERTVFVKTSDVYVNKSSGEALIAGSYVTTPDAEKRKWEIFVRQLDPESIDRGEK